MPRPRIHTTDHILDTARELIVTGGVRAATIDQVVARSGAPKGSIYHRFATINDVLAGTWLRSVTRAQAAFVDIISDVSNPVEAAVAGGLATLDFATEHPEDARLLAVMRREDLLGGVTDADLASALIETNEVMAMAITNLARRLYGRASRSALEQTLCATVDVPLGSLRRHLEAGVTPPRNLRIQLEAAIRAVLEA